jgi:hypothetical protein
MPSRDNAVRVGAERALRFVTLILLTFAAWSATREPSGNGAQTTDSEDLRAALGRWTAAPPAHAHVKLRTAPTVEERAWTRALRRAGTPVTWQGDSIPAMALEVAPVANPRGGTQVWVVAPAGASVAISDAVGPVDSVVARSGGATIVAPLTTGTITAVSAIHRASANPRDSLVLRRVLVIGRATWEAKFVITALEESGWLVDARLSVAPGIEIAQGAPSAPDTTRHLAVIVLDPPAARVASAIARYVRGGGGAIIAGEGGHATSLGAIAAGRNGSRVRPSSIAFADAAPRRALAFFAIAPRADAIALEEQGERVAVAARRVDAGRVVQLGYDETWRWRLGGGNRAVDAHGSWWSTLVSNVAYRAAVPLPDERLADDAPLARLVDALGPPRGASAPLRPEPWRPSPVLLFTFLITLLLAEVASRRLRGAP